MMKRLTLFLFLAVVFCAPTRAVYYLTLTSSGKNQLSYSYDGTTGIYTLTTSGSDPYVYANGLSRALDDDEQYLYFEYKCSRVVAGFQTYFGNTWTEERSHIFGNLPRSESQWRAMEFDLGDDRTAFGWGAKGHRIRLDFGQQSGLTIQVRNLKIRRANDVADEAKDRLSNHLENYLSTTFSDACGVDYVAVEGTQVKVSCHVDADNKYALVEVPPYQHLTELTSFVFEVPIPAGDTVVSIPRNILRNSLRFDRMLSKWAIIDRSGDTPRLACHARYADDVYVRRTAASMPLKGKKGLGGFWINGDLADIDDLGIQSVTVNIVLTSMISTQYSSFSNPINYTYAGRSYYIDQAQVTALDQTLKECTRRGIVVSAILLVSPSACPAGMSTLMIHPECDGGNYSMPNLTTLEGTCAYAAIVQFLADRYSRNANGRINHWILHNEVDFGKEWTNMGDQPVRVYMDTYLKSMRIVSYIARQFDQEAWVMGSYTHSWLSCSSDGPGYSTHNMLRLTQLFSAAEGDFPWGVAAHPYPQDLTKPKFWTNDTQSTYSLQTQYVTFKNLEVLNAWILAEENYCPGRGKRLLFLSENGTNSPDYSQTQLTLQAAGACWAWKKVAALRGIDGIQWHNWHDNRAEYGLRIGLRRYSDDETEPDGRKPVWFVWQAAGTDNEDAVFQPYMTTLGISHWDEIFDQQLLGVETPFRSDDTAGNVQIFTTSGLYVGCCLQPLPHGLYIVRRGPNSRKVLW